MSLSKEHSSLLERQCCSCKRSGRRIGFRGQSYETAYFQTKILILEKFWKVLKWKVLVYFMALWSVLWAVWYIFPVLICTTKNNLAVATLVMIPNFSHFYFILFNSVLSQKKPKNFPPIFRRKYFN
jgi:hypothetical protein